MSVVEWCTHMQHCPQASVTDNNISELGEDHYICYCCKEINITVDLNDVTCMDVDLICWLRIRSTNGVLCA
jgi:hypothetical protein